MKIYPVNSYINSKNTGWISAAGMGLSLLSGISKNKIVKKLHAPIAISTMLATIVHISIIEKYKMNRNNTN